MTRAVWVVAGISAVAPLVTRFRLIFLRIATDNGYRLDMAFLSSVRARLAAPLAIACVAFAVVTPGSTAHAASIGHQATERRPSRQGP